MMKKRVLQSLMVTVAMCVGTAAASARTLKLNATFDVFALGGASDLLDTKTFKSADEQYRSSYASGSKFVIGVEVPIGKILGVEGAYTSGPNNLRVTNISLNPTSTIVYGARTHIGSLDLVVHSPVAFLGIRPYAVVGWEYAQFAPTPAGITTATNQGFGAVSTATIISASEIGANFGGGLDRKIVKRVSLRLDVRDHGTGSPTYGLPPQATDTAIFPVSGLAQNVVYTVGIVIHFGKLKR